MYQNIGRIRDILWCVEEDVFGDKFWLGRSLPKWTEIRKVRASTVEKIVVKLISAFYAKACSWLWDKEQVEQVANKQDQSDTGGSEWKGHRQSE